MGGSGSPPIRGPRVPPQRLYFFVLIIIYFYLVSKYKINIYEGKQGVRVYRDAYLDAYLVEFTKYVVLSRMVGN
jgi:hypothetical protein